jgi:hypothetical protein
MPAVPVAIRQNIRLDRASRCRSQTNPCTAANVREVAATMDQMIMTQLKVVDSFQSIPRDQNKTSARSFIGFCTGVDQVST